MDNPIKDRKSIKLMQFMYPMTVLIQICETFADISTYKEFKSLFLNKHMTKAQPELQDTLPKLMKRDTPVTEQEVLQVYFESFEKQTAENIEVFLQRLLNQNFVILWSYFESYLDHVLEAILWKENHVLYDLSKQNIISKKNEVKLDIILDHESKDAMLEAIIGDIMENHSRLSASKKIRVHHDIGIPVERYFDFSQIDDTKFRFPEIIRLGGKYFETMETFRNDIVHKLQMPLANFTDLDKTFEYLFWLVRNISLIIHDKFDIPIDVLPVQE